MFNSNNNNDKKFLIRYQVKFTLSQQEKFPQQFRHNMNLSNNPKTLTYFKVSKFHLQLMKVPLNIFPII